MSSKFFVKREGSVHGPLTSAELKQLVARGELDPEDLLRRDEEEAWNTAGKFRGLFEPAPEAAPRPAPAPVPAVPTAALQTEPKPVAGDAAARVKGAVEEGVRRWRPFAEKYSREYELGMNEFLATVVGAGSLLLLIASTFIRWEKWSMEAGKVLEGVGNWKISAGLELFEGKLVCFLAVIGLVALAGAAIVKRILPVSLLVGAGVGVCSLLLTMSYMHQISAYQAEVDRQDEITRRNFRKTFGDESGKAAGENFMPTELDRPGIGLSLSFLCSGVAAATFIFSALSKPVLVPVLQKEAVHPLARKHGGLLIAVGAGFLIGMADYVFKY